MSKFSKQVPDFFKDKDGQVAVWQTPNLLLTGWFIFMLAWHIANDTSLINNLEFLSSAFLLAWSYLEIVSGVSKFRRLLGLVIMLWIIVSRIW